MLIELAGGGAVYAEVEGEGDSVVLVHAGVADARMWEPQWPALTASYRTVRYDMRGFGRSPAAPGPHEPASDLLALVDALDLGPVVLVASSYGGRVALEAAVARPEVVRGLVLLAPALPGHDWSEAMEAFDAEEEDALGRGDVDAAVEANLRMWVDGHGRPPESVDGQVRALVATMQRRAFELQLAAPEAEMRALVPDLPDRLSEIRVPALVMVGDHEAADFAAIADRVVARLPAARRVDVPGAAHLPSLERPDLVTPHLLAFLSAAPSPR